MSYEITITNTVVREVESGGEWTTVEKRPLTLEEGDKTFAPSSDQIKTIYGYTPKIVKPETVTIEIYKQTVPEIDLPEVIRAINMMD